MIDYIEKNGIKHGIDYLFKIIPELECYESKPQLCFSEWNENGKKIDSDIQNMGDSFNFEKCCLINMIIIRIKTFMGAIFIFRGQVH